MQLRDFSPDIFYPNHSGCFDGAVDAAEAPRSRWYGSCTKS
jgi:hypothetical protein